MLTSKNKYFYTTIQTKPATISKRCAKRYKTATVKQWSFFYYIPNVFNINHFEPFFILLLTQFERFAQSI